MIVAIKIVPREDGAAYTVVSEGDRVWHKKYASMEDATNEAVELHIMTPNDKQHGDIPTYAQGFTGPSVEVNLGELKLRGFRLDD